MTIDDSVSHDPLRRATRASSQLFTVRLWLEGVADGTEYRGQVRNVANGAFRGFRAWSDLATFMVAQMEDDESTQVQPTDGGS
jgi:hypothetical protein